MREPTESEWLEGLDGQSEREFYDTPAADTAVCRCGHPKSQHYYVVQKPMCHGVFGCPCTAFVADVNRPETCAKCFHPKPLDGSCAATTAYSCAAASDRGAGELADLLAAGLEAQNDADRYDSPWVSDETCMPGFVQVDGKIDLAALAAVLMAAGWEKR